MPNIEERERLYRKLINRWENEGGAIAPREWRRSENVDSQKNDAKSKEPESIIKIGAN